MRIINLSPLDHISVDVVFFDGEELGKPGVGGYCKGSEFFVEHLQQVYSVPPIGVVVLDMVGDQNLQIEREYHSISQSPVLWSSLSPHLEAQAVSINHPPIAIKDDQFPFIQRDTCRTHHRHGLPPLAYPTRHRRQMQS